MNERLQNIQDLVKKSPTNVFVECGVHDGASLEVIEDAAPEGSKIYGFDTFKGLDPQDHTPEVEEKTDWAFKCNDIGRVRDKCSKSILVVGHIPESLFVIPDVGFLHIDVDYYKPYMAILNHFYPLMVSGGIILADDTPSPQYRGSKLAMEEFFADKPEEILITPHTQPNNKKMYVVKV